MTSTEVLFAERHRDQFGKIQANAIDLSVRAWDSLGDWTSPGVADVWADAWLPINDAAVGMIVTATDAYFSMVTEDDALDLTGLTAAELRDVTADEYARRPLVTVYTALGKGAWWADAVRAGRERVAAMASLDSSMAQRYVADEWATAGKIVGYRRTLTGSSCVLCGLASTQRYTRGNLMPLHAHCIPSGAWISAPPSFGTQQSNLGSIKAATRRLYAGELIIMGTTAGDEVAVTPNHPVLTDQGWLPADLVRVGDDLLRHGGGHRVRGGRPHERQRPALIEDVWRSLCVQGRLVRMPLAAEDLHGNGTDGEVDVVWADGDFATVRHPHVHQPSRELLLVGGHGPGLTLAAGCTVGSVGKSLLGAPSGSVGRGRLGGPFVGRHSGRSVPPSSATPTRFDPPGEKFSEQSAPVYAQRGLDLVRRLAGQVERDRVVELRRVGFSGHVYNLHTDEGWFSSDSHIVSNCDCGVAPLKGRDDPGQVINKQLLDDLKSSGAVDRAAGFKVQQHPEVGPVLVRN